MDDDDPICFASEYIGNYLNEEAEWRWVSLNPDKAVGSVKDPN